MYFVLTFFEEGRPDCFVVWVLPSTKYGHRNNCILVADAGSELRQHFTPPVLRSIQNSSFFCCLFLKNLTATLVTSPPPHTEVNLLNLD